MGFFLNGNLKNAGGHNSMNSDYREYQYVLYDKVNIRQEDSKE